MRDDYYKLLGLEPDATLEDIKRAFRSLAHAYHPDKAGGDEALFKKLTRAYTVLSNAESRRDYDASRTADPVRRTAPEAASPAVKAARQPNKIAYVLGAIVFVIGITWYISSSQQPVSDSSSSVSDTGTYLPSTGSTGQDAMRSTGEVSMEQPGDPEQVSLGSLPIQSANHPVALSELTLVNFGDSLPGSAPSPSFGYYSFNPRTSTGYFLKLTFTATNTSTTEFPIRISTLTLVDQDGREFKPEQAYTCATPYSANTVQSRFLTSMALGSPVPIKPGIPCQWTLLFEVSNLSSLFSLTGYLEYASPA